MEHWAPGDTTYYLVFDQDQEFYLMTQSFADAWALANAVDGWLGETTFAKPLDLREKFGPETAKRIEDFLSGKTPGVRRGRPARDDKSDIDEDPSDCNSPS